MTIMNDVLFETDRTRVRPWRLAEAPRLYDLLGRWDVVKWLGDDPKVLTSEDEARDRIGAWAEGHRAGSAHGCWAVEVSATGVPGGSVILKPLPNGDGEVEIGWHFHPDSQGKGLAAEAAKGLLAKGFAEGLDEIFALTHPTNEASRKLCWRIGMTDLGVMTRWYPGPSQIFRITKAEHAKATLD